MQPHLPIVKVEQHDLRESAEFCKRTNPLIERLAIEVGRKGNVGMSFTMDAMDELEVIRDESEGTCSSKRAVSVLIEAAKLKKWLKILFSDHENKFKRYSVPIPIQYGKLKYELESLMKSLEYKMLMAAYKNRCNAKEPNLQKTKPISKKTQKPNQHSPPKSQRLQSLRSRINGATQNMNNPHMNQN